MTDTISVSVICALLVLAAWKDWRSRVLPNWLALAILLVAIGSVAIGSDLGELGLNLAHFAVALAIGFGLFAAGVIGGGDAKTYAAVAAAVPITEGHLLLAFTSAAMFVLAAGWFASSYFGRVTKRGVVGNGDVSIRDKYAEVPLGIAIAAGAICHFWLTRG
ncbi:prepilin peptidase [Erythrobacter sp. GH1-10]|uniref:prepilin peptidase n=1 Tax=Erythrobacter sp. GH1-10 TaxID=3349334 RepID=UPI003877EB7C